MSTALCHVASMASTSRYGYVADMHSPSHVASMAPPLSHQVSAMATLHNGRVGLKRGLVLRRNGARGRFLSRSHRFQTSLFSSRIRIVNRNLRESLNVNSVVVSSHKEPNSFQSSSAFSSSSFPLPPDLNSVPCSSSGTQLETEIETETEIEPKTESSKLGTEASADVIRLAAFAFASMAITSLIVLPSHAASVTAVRTATTSVPGSMQSASQSVQSPPTVKTGQRAPSQIVREGGGEGGDSKGGGGSKEREVEVKGSKGAKSSGRKEGGKKEKKVMELEERREWTKDLPTVSEKIPYTQILELKQTNQLKHILKHPKVKLQEAADVCLVVLEDNRVVRTVLPPVERDEQFWAAWKDLNMNEVVIDAFTPAPPEPQILPWGNWGPSLAWLNKVRLPQFTGKVKTATASKQVTGSKSVKSTSKPAKKMSAKERQELESREKIRLLELKKKEMDIARAERAKQLKKERVEKAKAEAAAKARLAKEEKENAKLQARLQKERERRESRQVKWAEEDALRAQQMQAEVLSRERWNRVWSTAANNEVVRFAIGILFFVFFYFGVVLNIKKRRKDYEDRVKLRREEEEERRKLREWEDEMTMSEEIAELKQKDGLTEEDQEKIRKEEEKNHMLAASKKFMRSGASVRRGRGSRKRPPQFLDLSAEVRFTDVAGLGDIRLELEEIVDFFTAAEKYRRRGSKIPSGILLCGEPGTGKTLLAKAVAGEAGVNFFSISASQFVEIYVGVGASRVRALYNEARENAPAVVFIDELDAVGRERGLTPGSGGQERDATLNQLLTCLDGFEGRGDVITIAATNRVDILDPALVRPGRFDRKIFIPKPGVRGRAQILAVHARDKPMAEDVEFGPVAEVTDGMSGAQLANIVDMAALKVLRDGGTEVTTDDLLEAAMVEEGGFPNTHDRSYERERQLALNEAALVTASWGFPDLSDIQMVSIQPRVGEEKGSVRIRSERASILLGSLTREGFLDCITVQLAPMEADELWYGKEEMSTIWADSTDLARKTARRLVLQGLSDRKDLYGLYETYQDADRIQAIDIEAEKIINICRQRAREKLLKNRSFMDALVEELLDKKTLQKPQIEDLATTYGRFDEPAIRAVEIREQQVTEFRERMIAEKRTFRENTSEVSKNDRGLVEAVRGGIERPTTAHRESN